MVEASFQLWKKERYHYQREFRITTVAMGSGKKTEVVATVPSVMPTTFLSPSNVQAAAVLQRKHNFPETQNFTMQTPSKQNYGNNKASSYQK